MSVKRQERRQARAHAPAQEYNLPADKKYRIMNYMNVVTKQLTYQGFIISNKDLGNFHKEVQTLSSLLRRRGSLEQTPTSLTLFFLRCPAGSPQEKSSDLHAPSRALCQADTSSLAQDQGAHHEGIRRRRKPRRHALGQVFRQVCDFAGVVQCLEQSNEASESERKRLSRTFEKESATN